MHKRLNAIENMYERKVQEADTDVAQVYFDNHVKGKMYSSQYWEQCIQNKKENK